MCVLVGMLSGCWSRKTNYKPTNFKYRAHVCVDVRGRQKMSEANDNPVIENSDELIEKFEEQRRENQKYAYALAQKLGVENQRNIFDDVDVEATHTDHISVSYVGKRDVCPSDAVTSFTNNTSYVIDDFWAYEHEGEKHLAIGLKNQEN